MKLLKNQTVWSRRPNGELQANKCDLSSFITRSKRQAAAFTSAEKRISGEKIVGFISCTNYSSEDI